jgi:cephalosporin-C deacetylase
MIIRYYLLIVALCSMTLSAQSQKDELIRILMAPTSDSYQYNVGERVDFEVAVYKYGKLVKDAKIQYTIAEEQMEPKIKSSTRLKSGQGIIEGISMSQPGFLRLTVEHQDGDATFSNTATAGIEVDNIKTFTKMPPDFDAFWKNQIKQARKIDLEPLYTRLPEKDNPRNIAYHIRFNHGRNAYIYGILMVPRKEGKFPAVLHVPGAGVRPYHGADVADEVISLQIGIHGIPVNLYESDIYENLKYGALSKYYWNRMDNREEYYYNRVYTACVRAIDFLHTVDKFDGENLAVTGGSQGGALTIVTAALDDRVDAIAAYYPALSDLEGFKNGRAGGWPRLFEKNFEFTPEKMDAVRYYDVVNFARNLNIPGFYAYGYNDNVCPASSIAAMLNEVDAKKEIQVAYDAAHWMYPEIKSDGKKWLFNYIKVAGY